MSMTLGSAAPIKLNATRPETWSTISIPVLPKPYHTYTDNTTSTSPPPPPSSSSQSTSTGRKFWKHLSLSHPKREVEWTVKEISRETYLRHYAKDDDGRYVGTEQPAEDCVLRRQSDVERYRGGKGPVMGDEEEEVKEDEQKKT